MFDWLGNIFGGGSNSTSSNTSNPGTITYDKNNPWTQADADAFYAAQKPSDSYVTENGGVLRGDVMIAGNGPITTTRSEGSIALDNPPAPVSTTPAKVIPDRSNSINMQNAGLRGADEQLSTGMSSIASKIANILSGYDSEKSRNQGLFDQEATTNTSNLQRNKWAALLNAAQGRQGLFGTLASIGALSGSGVDLANRAVQQGANIDITGATDAYTENQSSLNRSLNDFTTADEKRRREAKEARLAAESDLRNLVDTNKQKFYSNLASDYTEMEQFDKAKEYSDLAAALFPAIGRSSAQNPSLAAIDAPFTLPTLSNYIGGAQGNRVRTTPSAGAGQLPGLIALSPLSRDRDRDRV